MNRLLNLLKALLTNGVDNQSFIGARWLVLLLRLTPGPFKRNLALRIVAISPHHFYRSFNPAYQGMPQTRFMEMEFERNTTSRKVIVNQVLLPYVKPNDVCLDIGCGPGFLAKALSPHVKLIHACDISRGVLACADIINGAPNVRYVYSGESGFSQITDASVDLACSFAVIQHLRESVIKSLFMVAGQKVKPGGLCVFQVQLDDGKWKEESAWVADQTITGRLRLKYALNFFSRSKTFFKDLAAGAGFSVVAVRPVSELMEKPIDDVYHQHLLVLSKN